MAGVNGDRKGKKDDNGLGTAIDFVLSNAKLVLGVGGAAMLGIATLAVKRVRTRMQFYKHLNKISRHCERAFINSTQGNILKGVQMILNARYCQLCP